MSIGPRSQEPSGFGIRQLQLWRTWDRLSGSIAAVGDSLRDELELDGDWESADTVVIDLDSLSTVVQAAPDRIVLLVPSPDLNAVRRAADRCVDLGCGVEVEAWAGVISVVATPGVPTPQALADEPIVHALAVAHGQLVELNRNVEFEFEERSKQFHQLTTAARRIDMEQASLAKAAQKRQLDEVIRGSRYQLGDILISGIRQPRSLASAPRRLKRIFDQRVKTVPANAVSKQSVPPRTALRVGAILDEFSWDCFAPEADLVELDPSLWRNQFDEIPLDLVFVESAWRGNRGKWNYAINKFASRDPNHLAELLEHARRVGVPAVFWNKEDPVNFDEFITAASQFPAILTTDADIVAKYVDRVGHGRVDALPFAAQTRIHNPIGSRSNMEPKVCFAGAWRGEKYAQRSDDFRVLLDPAMELGALDIFDRYADHKDAAKLGFPEPYRSAVKGSLPYPEMVKAYRRYAAFLNVNSVTESPTMFSRRVFEVLACGTPMISTPSRGIEEMLGDHVITVRNPQETSEAVQQMIWNVDARERRGHLGYRHVHRHHTYRERFQQVVSIAGLDAPLPPEPSVTVVCVSNRPENLDHVIDSYRRQSYRSTEFIFVGNSDEFDREHVASRLDLLDKARALFLPEAATLADGLNAAIEIAEGDYIAKFDDDDDYGGEYLADMMLTFEYSGCAIAGKRSYYAYLHSTDRTVLRFPGREFRNASAVIGGTLVFDRRETSGIRFTPVIRGTDSIFIDDCRAKGLKVFSADRYNFVQHRHVDLSKHTWKIDESAFMKASVQVAEGYASNLVFI